MFDQFASSRLTMMRTTIAAVVSIQIARTKRAAQHARAELLVHELKQSLLGFGGFVGHVGALRPDVEAAAIDEQAPELRQFPDAPDAAAVIRAAISDAVPADVLLGPGAIAAAKIVLPSDLELPDPIVAFAGHIALAERELKIGDVAAWHPILEVKAGPLTAGKSRIALGADRWKVGHDLGTR